MIPPSSLSTSSTSFTLKTSIPLLILLLFVQLVHIPSIAAQQQQQQRPARSSLPERYPVNSTLTAPVTTLRPRRPHNATDAAELMTRIGHRLLYTIGFYSVRNPTYAERVGSEWMSPRAPFKVQTTPELMQAIRSAFLQRHATGDFRGVVYSCLKEGEVASFITWRATAADRTEGAAADTINNGQPDRLTVRVHCIAGVRLGVDATTIDFLAGRPKPATPGKVQDKVIVTSGTGSVSRDATTGSLQIQPQMGGTAISTTSVLFPNGTIYNLDSNLDNTNNDNSNNKDNKNIDNSTKQDTNKEQDSSNSATTQLTNLLPTFITTFCLISVSLMVL
ncbi:hypothetical protein BDF22DRAFT_685044 [Syncephalis plumigaleata]|nr:hypothetical protein BDF22DRAFT_685044 [Syncephalis plumigaleata]